MARQYLRFLLVLHVIALIVMVYSKTAMAADITRGKTIYEKTCVVCHGDDGTGAMPGVPDMTGNTGILSKTDQVLLKNMKQGLQKSGATMVMPPKGGDPNLADEDLQHVLDYMRKEFDG